MQTPIQLNRPQALVIATQPPAEKSVKRNRIAMTEAVSLPLGVPAFRRMPSTTTTTIANNVFETQTQSSFNRKVMYQQPTPFSPQQVKMILKIGRPP